jgi:2-dehydropantoate 2-reductase
MKLLIVGAGATGGYFGARLVEAGRDATFLVRESRAQQLRRDGLLIKSPHGDVSLTPKLLMAAEVREPFDAILVTVKAYALDAAISDFAPAVGADTMIVPILNGMKHIDDLVQRFGARAVVGGVAKVATTLDDAGAIVQLAEFQELAYGELDGAESSRTDALHAFLSGAGFEAKLTRGIILELWQKWILLATMGGITTLMRGAVGEIEAAENGPEFVTAFVDEIVAVTTALGHPPTPAFLANAKAMLTAKGSPLASSMFRDLQRGARIEADHIVGDLLARGRRAGVATPLLGAAYTHLSVYQNRLKA